ncbi:MAG: OmpA family protein [Bacteroidales bacterium]|nr:OmpA family protein [Bacteroidales bacterium]
MRQILPYILPVILLLESCTTSRNIHKADKLYGYGEYYAAAAQYAKAYRHLKSNEKKRKAHTSFFRGECFRRINQPFKAESEYRKAIRYNYTNDTLFLRFAQTLHKNAKYQEAEKAYETFLKDHAGDILALNGLYACHHIDQWEKSRTNFEVKKADNLNSRKGDFSPVLVPGDYHLLYLTSSAHVTKEIKTSKITGLPNNDFWVSRQDINGNWSKPEYIESAINSEFDEGVASFAPDGKSMYFTRCITKSDSIETSSKVELFRSVRSGAEWSTPEKLRVYRDSTKVFAHPAVSPDGNYLYFASDLPGGFGGKDIWRCEMSENVFGPPENLGADINTPGDEVFPYFRENGEFYFSSDGQPGFGGLDLFKALPNNNHGFTVENLQKGINSNGDDFGITFFGKEDRGFFSSNRKELKGWDKIWSFERPNPYSEIKGIVTDRYGEPIPDATIKIVNDKGLNIKTRSQKDGTYSLKVEKDADYAMMATCRSYLNNSNRFYALDREKDTTYVVDFTLTPLHRPVRIENIFFGFGEWALMPESTPALDELVKLLQDNPHITVEIGAHTDRVGTDEYNNTLSEKRAASVVEYLQQKGIEKERLEAHGYGKTQPARVDSYMENKNKFLTEGSFLTEDFIKTLPPLQQETADQINRRCEFKVLKTTYKLF